MLLRHYRVDSGVVLSLMLIIHEGPSLDDAHGVASLTEDVVRCFIILSWRLIQIVSYHSNLILFVVLHDSNTLTYRVGNSRWLK